MAAVISEFEIVESIRFLASFVGTEGVSEKAKVKANQYLERLVDALEPAVNKTTGQASGLTL